ATGRITEISARLRSREHYRLRLDDAPPALVAELRTVPGVAYAELAEQAASAGPGGEPMSDAPGRVVELTIGVPERTVPRVVSLVVSRGAAVLECARRESTLSEIFSEIITEDTRRGDAA